MQSTTMTDGSVFQEWFTNSEGEIARRAARAALDENVRSVTFTKCGRNDPCPCGSGKKFKKCCIWKVDRWKVRAAK